MKANLVEREPQRLAHWEKQNAYYKALEARKDAEPFILHDGPPFANGDIHLGHVLNKVLKDIVVRYKTMRGYEVNYVTGWDCHGLPIEHAVTKNLQKNTTELDPVTIRRDCTAFAEKYIDIQLEQFKRLGIHTDWENHYRTMNPTYEADILRTFAAFVKEGLVYRSKKPVYWSIPYKTALAEAEIEYAEHISNSIWVPFKSLNAKEYGLPENTSTVIWTTTPWTLPANLAIAVHPRFEYTLIEYEGHNYLVARELAETFIKDVEWEGKVKITDVSIKGEKLEGLRNQHPFIDRESPIVLAEYVTLETGTGCVHTAPGHGHDDYITGLKYGLEVYSPLDENSRYVDDGQIPESLVGKSVFEKKNGASQANEEVLKLLQENGSLIQHTQFTHQYPHCWRSKTPVIFRAMDQFFMRLDHNDSRQKVLNEIDKVIWIPDWGKNRIHSAVENRPDWCISRQRSWGVPIPVFYNEAGDVLLQEDVIEAIAQKFATEGSDIWFTQSEEELLHGVELPEGWSLEDIKKGEDTLDVWFDSGSSHAAVLNRFDGLHRPADLYLEGSDQHRGWFQSSIWTSVIENGNAPYKTVLTHGFVVDENGRKMSKSQGAKTATEWLKQYGADILRLLILSEDYRGDIPIGNNIIKQISGIYRLIRNTLRFQIGSLYDFDPATDTVERDDLHILDKWALEETRQLIQQVTKAYDNYDFPKVFQLIQLFCNNTLSATYHDIIKDRLYTLAPDDPKRRSSQTVIYAIFEALTKLLVPVLPFTADEAIAYYENDEDFSENLATLQDWPIADNYPVFETEAQEVNDLLKFKSEQINEKLEKLRQEKTIGQSLDAEIKVALQASNPIADILQKYSDDLAELFIVSSVILETSSSEDQVAVARAGGERCPRSWRWVPELVETENWGRVSPRDKAVHDTLYSK